MKPFISNRAGVVAGDVDKVALLTPEQASVVLQLSTREIPKYIPPIIFGARTVRYRLSDIEEVVKRKAGVAESAQDPSKLVEA